MIMIGGGRWARQGITVNLTLRGRNLFTSTCPELSKMRLVAKYKNLRLILSFTVMMMEKATLTKL